MISQIFSGPGAPRLRKYDAIDASDPCQILLRTIMGANPLFEVPADKRFAIAFHYQLSASDK
jgi:hypothetical protein